MKQTQNSCFCQSTKSMTLLFIYTQWKDQKTNSYLTFSGGIEKEQGHGIV